MRTTSMLFAVVVAGFTVAGAVANQPANGTFDTNFSGWGTAGSWSTLDAHGSMSSGSLLASNVTTAASLSEVATTCIPYLPATASRIKSKVYIPSGQPTGTAMMAVRTWTGPNCTGTQSAFHYLDADEVSATDVWNQIDTTVLKDAGAASMQLIFVIDKQVSGGALAAYLDDVSVWNSKADADASGIADLVWRHGSSGADSIWLMNGGAIASSATLPTVSDSNWYPYPGGDFQRDGKADILWRHGSTGANVIWFLNGTAAPVTAILPSVPTEWYPAAIGDFQNDGKTDIFWRNGSTGANVIWFMDGANIAATGLLPPVSTYFRLNAWGDFQGDGKTDIFWHNTSTLANVVWLMDGATVAASALLPSMPSSSWNIAAWGDFQGDGKTDLLWINTTGETLIWFMNGLSYVGATAPSIPSGWTAWKVADFQGDMKDDLFFRNFGTGGNVTWLMDGARVAAVVILPTVDPAFFAVTELD